MDDPVPYCSIRARFMFANLLIVKRRKTRNSQLIDTRNQNPTYGNDSNVSSHRHLTTVQGLMISRPCSTNTLNQADKVAILSAPSVQFTTRKIPGNAHEHCTIHIAHAHRP